MREVEGFFNNLRQWLLGALLVLFYGTVWLKWDGRQAVLFDLPARQIHIFGITFWQQDFMLLAWILIIAAYGLFTVTNYAGRRSEEHTSELQSRPHVACRLLLDNKT